MKIMPVFLAILISFPLFAAKRQDRREKKKRISTFSVTEKCTDQKEGSHNDKISFYRNFLASLEKKGSKRDKKPGNRNTGTR